MNRAFAEVIGDPIARSKSPAIHGFWLSQLGIDAEYCATLVTTGELSEWLAGRRGEPAWRGCNVTMPHKQAIIAHLDRLDPLAAAIGAVNTVVSEGGALVGYNTDAGGFLEPLSHELSQDHYFRMARVLGAGGAARGIVAALVREKFLIVLGARNPAKARALLEELDPGGDHHAVDLAHFSIPTDFAFDDRAGCLDLVINASPLGMRGQPPLIFDWSHAPPSAIGYDIVTDPLETPFLISAVHAGHRVIDGLSMLIGQAALAFERFFGAPAPRQYDNELRTLLASSQAAGPQQ